METLAALDARVSTTWLRKHLWRSIFIVLVLMYAAQLYSPLRISEDTVGFLSAAESGYRGEGLLYEGREMPNLSGYPVMIVGLLKLGLGHPWALAGLNLLFLTAALWGVWTIARREYEMTEERTWKLLCLCLSSFVVLKHSTIPMSDIPFLGILMPCLVVMLRAEKETARRRWAYVSIAIGLVLLSLWTRRAGVALAVPLAVTIWKCMTTVRQRVAAIAVAGVGTAAIVSRFTLHDFSVELNRMGVLETARTILITRLSEFFQITWNLPMGKLPLPLPMAFGLAAFSIGCVLYAALQVGKFGPVEIFTLTYVGVLFVWPYPDPRFWLPIAPMVLLYMLQALRWRRLRIGYTLLYGMLGCGSLAQATYVTFSGEKFPDLYASGHQKINYCVANQTCPDIDPSLAQPSAVRVIRTFR